MNLLYQLGKPAVEQAKREIVDIQALIDAQKAASNSHLGIGISMQNKCVKKFDLDENQIKPYFEVSTVLEKKAFSMLRKNSTELPSKKEKDLPVYHPDVVAYEVFDRDGKSLAIYYLDFYTRDNKNGGAWMSNFVEQSFMTGTKPVIVNVFNYQNPLQENLH